MRNNTKKGFTLVELLVVIAILAILATVSVVGYTSYIDGTNLKVDENLAAQLNHFLDAYQVNHREDITTDNVWHVTNDIRELGGLDKIQAQSDDYHFFFKFDTDEDGNYVGGEYVVAKDVAEIAPLDLLIKAINPEERPGFFLIEGNLYFLVDTTGSALAEAIRGFYTFDHLEGTQAEKWEAFQELVGEVAAEGHINIETALNNNVFVTLGGTEVVDGATPNGYVFHTEDGIVMEPSVNVTISTTVTVPSNVTLFEDGAFNVTYTGDGVLEFEVSAEELAGYLCEGSLPEDITFVVDGEEWEYVCGDDTQDSHITNGTVTKEFTYSNTLKDFNIKIEGAENKVHNEVTTEDATAGDKTLAINKIPHIVWDIGSFDLTLDASTFVADDETKPLSSKRVNWSLVDANGNPVADDYYAGVKLDGKTITLSKVGTTYPNTEYFYVKATVANNKEVYATYKIVLSGLEHVGIMLDGANTNNTASSNGSIEVFWGETEDGNRNSYTVSLGTKTPDGNTIEGFTYADTITITVDGNYKPVEKGVTTLKTSFDTFPADTTTQATTITVNVGGYVEYKINIDVTYARVLFAKMFEDLKNIGTEGTISAEDLFKKIGNVNPDADVKINAYLGATADQALSELNDLQAYSDKQEVYFDKGSAASFNFNGGTIDLGLGEGDNEIEIVFVVTVDGVRASENIKYTVVNGTNVRKYSDIETLIDTTSGVLNNVKGSIVLLRDNIKMETTSTYKNFTITSGNTLYGNYNTLNIENGITIGANAVYAIIRLNNATMQDTKVVGKVYTVVELEGGKQWSANAVQAAGDQVLIKNCYIANTRAPLIIRGDSDEEGHTVTILDNVMLYGGRCFNVDMRNGEMVVRNRLVTVNQSYNNGPVGAGICFWVQKSENAKITVESGARLIPYNFVSEGIRDVEGALPNMSINFKNVYSVDINFGNVLSSILGECVKDHDCSAAKSADYSWCCSDLGCSHKKILLLHGSCRKADNLKPDKFDEYIITTKDGVRYFNLATLNINVGLGGEFDMPVKFNETPKDFQAGTISVTTTASVRFSVLTNTITGDNKETNDKYTADTLFANSMTAASDYHPDNWDFGSNDVNTDSIIPDNVTD